MTVFVTLTTVTFVWLTEVKLVTFTKFVVGEDGFVPVQDARKTSREPTESERSFMRVSLGLPSSYTVMLPGFKT